MIRLGKHYIASLIRLNDPNVYSVILIKAQQRQGVQLKAKPSA